MAQTKTRRSGSSTRSARSNRNTSARKRSSAKRAPTRRPRASSGSSRSSTGRRSPRSRASANGAGKSRSASRPSTNGVTGTIADISGSIGSAVEKAGSSVGTVAQRAKVPALVGTAAAAGLAGGVALRSRMLSRPKVAGVPLPRRNGAFKTMAHEMQQVGKEIGKAGFRLGVGDLDMEVQRGRGERRDSPLEVLLHSLTSRRSKR
jgi:hypothetical protein